MNASDYISAAGVVVNGLFSFLVWKATKNSGDIAKQSFQMAKRMQDKEQRVWSGMQLFLRKQTLSEISKVQQALASQNEPHSWPIMQAPKSPSATLQQQMDYFTEDERQELAMIWSRFIEYIRAHWSTSIGTMKSEHEITDEEKEQIVRASLKLSQFVLSEHDRLEQKWNPAQHEQQLIAIGNQF